MSASTSETESQAKSTGIVSMAILCSRILGLVRDQMLNGLFGAHFTGIFTAAFRTPNMLRDLFAEGALSTAFVTTFTKKIKSEGDEAAWQLGRKMLALSICFMSMVSLAGIAIAPWLVRLLNPGWDRAASIDLCADLVRIMYPFITIVSVTALVMGMLNSKKVFFVPAVASAFFNLGCIVGGVVIAWLIDPGFRSGTLTEKGLIGFAIGTLVGGLLQLGIQIPSLRRVGFRFGLDFKWRDQGVSEVLHLMWPSLIAAGGTQIGVFLNSVFASFTPGQESANAWLANAQRLQQLPLGLFGVAVATVTLPMLSRLATDGMTPAFRGALAKGLRLVLFLTLPSAVGLCLLAHEIVSILFEHGKFTSADVDATAGPLQAYAFGLVFYSSIKVLQPAFYTIGKRFVPMLVSLGIIVFTATVNAITVFVLKWDHTALAWATAAGLLINFSALYINMSRVAGGLETRLLLTSLTKLSMGLVGMAVICLLAKISVLSGWSSMSFMMQTLSLGGTVLVAAGVYFFLTQKLGVEEAREFLSIVSRRFKR
jgi:putative peptidoglycan lipid II flippase